MSKSVKKFLRLPLSLAFLFGGGAFVLISMAEGSLTSVVAMKLSGGIALFGLFIGGLISLADIFDQRETLRGFEYAIGAFFISLPLGLLAIATLMEGPSDEQRRQMIVLLGVMIGWWSIIFLGAVLTWGGNRWGGLLQAVVFVAPFVILSGFVLQLLILPQPSADSVSHTWNGVRMVIMWILGPTCFVGFVSSIFLRSLFLATLILATTLLLGAALGEWLLRPVGWPVTGAFAGGIGSVTILITSFVVVMRRADRREEEESI